MEFSKMGIIAASTKAPDASVRSQRSEVISQLGPAVQVALQFQRILSVVSLSVLPSKFVAWQTLVASRVASHTAYNCKSVRRLRKKLEYEFFTFVLGSGGNSLFCIMFWPGWWILGFVALAIWSCVG
ncbi:hypothetical protein PG994_013555 [Apiospora phragmitis]|uniref:Uncharacterized protein n=1 Tax=Apiospora phragmitis TaxID=2905665 RepID=A0ABR1T9I9_9PEZI